MDIKTGRLKTTLHFRIPILLKRTGKKRSEEQTNKEQFTTQNLRGSFICSAPFTGIKQFYLLEYLY